MLRPSRSTRTLSSSRHCHSVSSRLLAGAVNCRVLPCASDGACAKHPAVVWARGGQMLRAHLPLVCACPCASSHAYAGPSGASHSVRTAIKRSGQECDVAVPPVNGSRAHTPRRLRGPCWKSRLIRGTGRGVGELCKHARWRKIVYWFRLLSTGQRGDKPGYALWASRDYGFTLQEP